MRWQRSSKSKGSISRGIIYAINVVSDELGGIRRYKLFNNKGIMKENKLGRKFANTWSPPNRIRCKRNHNFATRRANKGVRKNAKLMIVAELGQVCNGESNQTVNLVSYDKVSATLTLPTRTTMRC